MTTNKFDLSKKKEIEEELAKTIDKIRPYVQHDGGDLEFVNLDDEGIAHVRFWGACAGCFMAEDDFNNGIQNFIMDEIPDINGVVLDEPNLADALSDWF